MSAEATVRPAEHLRFSPIPTLLASGTDLGEGALSGTLGGPTETPPPSRKQRHSSSNTLPFR